LKPIPDLEVVHVPRDKPLVEITGIEEELAGPPTMPRRLLPLIRNLVRLAGIQEKALSALKKPGGTG
jgi:hypothetical protein